MEKKGYGLFHNIYAAATTTKISFYSIINRMFNTKKKPSQKQKSRLTNPHFGKLNQIKAVYGNEEPAKMCCPGFDHNKVREKIIILKVRSY